jgi:hypothetical protein
MMMSAMALLTSLLDGVMLVIMPHGTPWFCHLLLLVVFIS